jgi:hypothetical protein
MSGVQLQAKGKLRRMTNMELRATHLYVIMNLTATETYHRQACLSMMFAFLGLAICFDFLLWFGVQQMGCS